MMATLAPERFSEALHRYLGGYESFRPGQESIVKSIAAGRDACVSHAQQVVGKSLCYHITRRPQRHHRGRHLPVDRLDAGPGRATPANGNFRRPA